MKKVLPILLVIAMALPAMATVTITAVDNGDGTVTIGYVADAGEVIRGAGIKLTVGAGDEVDGVVDALAPDAASPFNAYIDYYAEFGVTELPGTGAHPVADPAAAGPLALPAAEAVFSAGVLDESGNTGGAEGTGILCTITLVDGSDADGFAVLTIAEDALRGGVVGDGFTADQVVYPAALTIEIPGDICLGDLNGDGFKNTFDMSLLVNKLMAKGAPYNIPSTDPAYQEAADLNADGYCNTFDMSMLVNMLSAAGAPYNIPCN